MQLLDAVLEVSSLTVNFLVNPLWTLLHVGNDEARIFLGLFAFGAHHLGFIDDPTFPRPALVRAILTLAIDVLGLSRRLRSTTGRLHSGLGFALQHRIGRQI